MRKPIYRFQSYGIPEPLTRLRQWVGWRDGLPVPLALGPVSIYGWALPAHPASWVDFRTALHNRVERKADGISFVATPEDPFYIIKLMGAVREGRLDKSARAVVRACRTYAEVDPRERDVILIVAFEPEVAAVIGGCKLPLAFLPDDCPVHRYEGVVYTWPALLDVPLSGMYISSDTHIRLLPEPSTHHKEIR